MRHKYLMSLFFLVSCIPSRCCSTLLLSLSDQITFTSFREFFRLDVNWMQSLQQALFIFICAQFGATGAIRRAVTLMLIPMVRKLLLHSKQAPVDGSRWSQEVVLPGHNMHSLSVTPKIGTRREFVCGQVVHRLWGYGLEALLVGWLTCRAMRGTAPPLTDVS